MFDTVEDVRPPSLPHDQSLTNILNAIPKASADSKERAFYTLIGRISDTDYRSRVEDLFEQIGIPYDQFGIHKLLQEADHQRIRRMLLRKIHTILDETNRTHVE